MAERRPLALRVRAEADDLFSSVVPRGGRYRRTACRKRTSGTGGYAALFAASIAIYVLVRLVLNRYVTDMYSSTWGVGQELVNALYFTLIGASVYLNILAFDGLAGSRGALKPNVERALRWAAGASFTLYLTHQPMLVFASCLFPATRTTFPAGL